MKRLVAICVGCFLLAIALVIGMINGWIDFKGRPIQRVRELQPHAEERNRQIERLIDPRP